MTVATIVAAACTAGDTAGRQPAGPTTTAAPDKANSGDQLILWINHKELVPMTDADLDAWKSRGIDGFISVVQWLYGIGGGQQFTGDPNAALASDNFLYQRQLRDSRIVARAAERGMKVYLGFYFANYAGGTTPLVDWFDDGGWSGNILPKVRDIAGAAKLFGFAGLAFDQELYNQQGNVQNASWSWGYAGNTRPEAETRAKVKQRGAQLMQTILSVFPDVEIAAYYTLLPDSWEELVQLEVNKQEKAMVGNVHIDLWNGLTSVPGYRAIRFFDSIFFKTPHIRGSSWDTALQYNANRLYSLFSRRWENWAYASSRVHLAPFAWIDNGATEFESARSPEFVAEQLAAFATWAAGREVAIFAFSLNRFDYTEYAPGMRAASAPAEVDTEPPTVTARTATPTGTTVDLVGTSRDNMGIRAVRWQVTGGASGAAALTWDVRGGSYRSKYEWEMDWTAPGVPLKPGRNEIVLTVEDLKGLTSTTTISVTAPG